MLRPKAPKLLLHYTYLYYTMDTATQAGASAAGATLLLAINIGPSARPAGGAG